MILVALQRVIACLERQRLPCSTERAAHVAAAAALTGDGFNVAMERRLAPTFGVKGSRLDIAVDTGDGLIAVEVKRRGGRNALIDQIERYAAHPDVLAIIVLAGIAVAMPERIHDKPIFVVSIGKAYLA